MESIYVPRSIARRLRIEAEKQGLSLEEYLMELVTQNLDPEERVREYIEVAKELLEQAQIELSKSDLRQAAEKIWSATALTVKAYATWREGKRLKSHGELWKYKEVLVKELGEWIRDSWYAGHSMHTCFYEGWCTRKDVEIALEKVKKLVKVVEEKIKQAIREPQ